MHADFGMPRGDEWWSILWGRPDGNVIHVYWAVASLTVRPFPLLCSLLPYLQYLLVDPLALLLHVLLLRVLRLEGLPLLFADESFIHLRELLAIQFMLDVFWYLNMCEWFKSGVLERVGRSRLIRIAMLEDDAKVTVRIRFLPVLGLLGVVDCW